MSASLPEVQDGLRPAPARRRAPRRSLEDAALAELPERLAAPGSGPDTAGSVTVPVLDPATGGHLLDVEPASPECLQDNLSAAVEVSRTDWSWLSGEDRARHLFAVADVLTGHARALVVTAALTTGRPVALGTALDTPALLDAAFSAAGWADKLAVVGVRAQSGVLEVSADWATSPADLLTRALAGLAAGRAVVLRPTPALAATCARLVRAAGEAGLPAGLLRLVPGSPDPAGTAASAADVVLAAADLDACVAHLLGVLGGGAVGRPGGTRVLVEEALAADLLDRLESGAAALRVGEPLDRATQVGPSPTPGLAHGASGARQRPVAVPQELPHGGWWSQPTVVTVGPRTPPTPPGPLVGVRTVRSTAEALALLTAAPAAELTVWGERPGGVHRWRALTGVARLGLDTGAAPDHRTDALTVLRGLRG